MVCRSRIRNVRFALGQDSPPGPSRRHPFRPRPLAQETPQGQETREETLLFPSFRSLGYCPDTGILAPARMRFALRFYSNHNVVCPEESSTGCPGIPASFGPLALVSDTLVSGKDDRRGWAGSE